MGLVTPIPKFKGSKKMALADGFRGIAVNSVYSKIFEHCLMSFMSHIKTSARQFGFKEKIGCNHAIHTVRKVINYFNDKKFTINIGVIDLKKAFDKVNIYALLSKLLKFNINIKIISILENWFTNSAACVKFENTLSKCVNLTAGVRQGGILSPFLFSLFVDSVLENLANSNLGCFVDNICYNSIMYADDLIILSQSVTELQHLFNICAANFDSLDLPINAAKCHCTRVGPRHKTLCKKINLKGLDIDWVEEILYLGVPLKKGNSFSCNCDSTVKIFYASSNTILSKLGSTTSIDVVLQLLKAQAVPHLMYGIAAATLSESDIKRLTFVYNSIFVKVFETKDNSVITYCQNCCNFFSFNALYDYLRLMFLNNLFNTNFINDDYLIDAVDMHDYKHLLFKYKIDEDKLTKNNVIYRIRSCNLY